MRVLRNCMDTKKESRIMKEVSVEHGSFYERIMRLGHGPPEGIKLDRAGWRWYFDQMHYIKRSHLLETVFGDVLPREWRALPEEEIRLEWLDGVDKAVTSRSKAFAKFPRYQYIWQNGYGPETGENLDIEGWEKYVAEMPEEKRKEMEDELFTIPDDPDHDKLWNKYVRQINESEGFDVDVRITCGGAPIVPMFDDMSQAMHDDGLFNYSIKALHGYNGKEGTDYAVTEVVKACNQAVFGVMYYITFEAINSEDHTQVFQAKVHQLPDGSDEIVLVRPKPSGSSFYNRIIRAGYGPPDGVELESPEAWRVYFDTMDNWRLHCLILNVFADDIPKKWNAATIRLEWLDGVDKDVTSHSLPFSGTPLYQYIWQNGYGPDNGENLSLEGWEEYRAKMPEDKLNLICEVLFHTPVDHVHRAKIRKTYHNQVKESQGFDVDVRDRDRCGAITPMYHDMSEYNNDDDLIRYSRKALKEYNREHGTNYTLNHVVKACHQIVCGFMYHITFQASNSKGRTQVFLAKVHHPPGMEAEDKIVQVRTKPEIV